MHQGPLIVHSFQDKVMMWQEIGVFLRIAIAPCAAPKASYLGTHALRLRPFARLSHTVAVSSDCLTMR